MLSKSEMSAVLYITYDGLLDPLGGSQILPYIYGIAQHSGPIHILSFEKKQRFVVGKDILFAELIRRGISWHPLLFSDSAGPLGRLSKVWDMSRMYSEALRFALRYHIRIVHARSHTPAQVALFLKRLLGIRMLFDFRGLWVDERVDKGGWDLRRFTHRWQYRYFKAKERSLLKHADQVVVLTEAVVPEVVRLGVDIPEKITVIPCCADFEHFILTTPERRLNTRQALGLPASSFVLGYLGSVGQMYMLDRYLRLFELASSQRGDVYALFVTPDCDAAKELVCTLLLPVLHNRVIIDSVQRSDVPIRLAAMDLLVSFVRPSYARMASSPTKNAEAFASGLPVICNPGVGDIEAQVIALRAGRCVDPNSDTALEDAVKGFEGLCATGGATLRDRSRLMFDLEIAAMRYEKIYLELKKVNL